MSLSSALSSSRWPCSNINPFSLHLFCTGLLPLEWGSMCEEIWRPNWNRPSILPRTNVRRCLIFDVMLLAHLTSEQPRCLCARIAYAQRGVMYETRPLFLHSCPPTFKTSIVCPKRLDCFGGQQYLLKLVGLPTSSRLYYLTIAPL